MILKYFGTRSFNDATSKSLLQAVHTAHTRQYEHEKYFQVQVLNQDNLGFQITPGNLGFRKIKPRFLHSCEDCSFGAAFGLFVVEGRVKYYLVVSKCLSPNGFDMAVFCFR